MIGTTLGVPQPMQMGSMPFPQQAATIPMQAGTISALQANNGGIDIGSIMNMMIMLIVVVMMMKMMTSATKEMK